MMQSEFEELIGREIEPAVYAVYEAMYSTLPEGITKKQFVKMLNIDVIPEDPRAVASREESAAYIYNEEARLDEEIATAERWAGWYQYTENSRMVKYERDEIKRLKEEKRWLFVGVSEKVMKRYKELKKEAKTCLLPVNV